MGEFCLNRMNYYNYIEEKLDFLAYRIKRRGKINLLELNIHSETFFAELCNLIFGFNLTNINAFVQNTEGIDLVDKKNKIVVQVSATCNKTKIQSSLNKDVYKQYVGYSYKFISISKDASANLKKSSFIIPNNLVFDPQIDILDCSSLLRDIQALGIDTIRAIYDFIKKELGSDIDLTKMESNLAKIITILAKEKLDLDAISSELNSFAIEDKISFNDLQGVSDFIDDYKIYYHKLDDIYAAFDREGQNKSYSVLQEIKKQYVILSNGGKSATDTFYGIIDNLKSIIRSSSNYTEMPFEELNLCVSIIVVDAFIRCKIFKNPEGYKHVTTRQCASGVEHIL